MTTTPIPTALAFTGRTVLITGIGRAGQVGDAVARAFAEAGALVLLVGHSIGDATARAEELSHAGLAAAPFACDLTAAAAVAELAREVRKQRGEQLCALVNVAGGFAMSGPVAESDAHVFERQMAINFTTGYLATRAFLPMLRAGRGAVVYFASEVVLPGIPVAKVAAYAAAKSAVVALMRAVADEERPNGVRANAVAPSAIRTATNVASMGDAHYVEREDVAATVMYLCSDAARAVSGQVIRLR